MIQKEKSINNNSKINSLENKINTKISNTSNHSGIAKASHSITTNIHTEIENKNPLFSRAINTQSTINKNYKDNVTEIVKIYALQTLELQIRLITKIDTSYSVQYDENDSLEDLAFKWAAGHCTMHKLKINELPGTEQAEQEVLDSILDILLIKTEKDGLDTVYNGGICWNMLATFFKQEWAKNENRKELSQIVFTQNKTDKLIKSIDTIINQAIINLEKIKNETYLPVFRTVTDLDINLNTKFNNLGQYFKFRPIEDNFDVSLTFHLFAQYVLPKMNAMINQVSNLQMLLDYLKEIKQAPKTLSNVKLLLSICTQCIQMFNDDKNLFILHKNQTLNSQHTKDYLQIQSLLKTLESKIQILINAQSDDWNSSYTQTFLKKNNNQNAKKRITKPQGKENQKKTNNCSVQPQQKIVRDTIENPIKQVHPQEIPNEEKHEMLDLSLPNLSATPKPSHNLTDSSETLQEIERENNFLMEVFRQRLESDRKEKLERKERKIKKMESPPELTANEIEKKASGKKLSSHHQETLKKLFEEKPEHFAIDAASVENLIKALNGKTEGKGNGSQFTIYWGNSKKQAGTYEVAHGRDASGYLTSIWASNVADAIKVGIRHGLILPETINCIIC